MSEFLKLENVHPKTENPPLPSHKYKGVESDQAPIDAEGWRDCRPVYMSFPGWTEVSKGVTEFDKLPRNAKQYLRTIEQLVGCPITLISTGPDRNENVVMADPLAA